MLEVADLARRYGDVVALDGLSFTVEAGQLFGFVGPNGAGKTTTMRIVLGVLEPDAGEVRWRGRPLDPATRAPLGYIPEGRGLYPKMRGRDPPAYLAPRPRLRPGAAGGGAGPLDRGAGAHALGGGAAGRAADHWTGRLGVADGRGDRVEALSLGNQQRVQLAAALVHGPELLVLDEPFSGLDPVGVDVLSGVLLEIAAGGVPVIFSSHQLELVERLCRAVAIVAGGGLVASGTVGELRAAGRDRLYRVTVDAPANGWAERLDGVQIRDAGHGDGDGHGDGQGDGSGGVLLALADGVDDQLVL